MSSLTSPPERAHALCVQISLFRFFAPWHIYGSYWVSYASLDNSQYYFNDWWSDWRGVVWMAQAISYLWRVYPKNCTKRRHWRAHLFDKTCAGTLWKIINNLLSVLDKAHVTLSLSLLWVIHNINNMVIHIIKVLALKSMKSIWNEEDKYESTEYCDEVKSSREFLANKVSLSETVGNLNMYPWHRQIWPSEPFVRQMWSSTNLQLASSCLTM